MACDDLCIVVSIISIAALLAFCLAVGLIAYLLYTCHLLAEKTRHNKECKDKHATSVHSALTSDKIPHTKEGEIPLSENVAYVTIPTQKSESCILVQNVIYETVSTPNAVHMNTSACKMDIPGSE